MRTLIEIQINSIFYSIWIKTYILYFYIIIIIIYSHSPITAGWKPIQHFSNLFCKSFDLNSSLIHLIPYIFLIASTHLLFIFSRVSFEHFFWTFVARHTIFFIEQSGIIILKTALIKCTHSIVISDVLFWPTYINYFLTVSCNMN